MSNTLRGYLTIAELQDYANITVTNEAEAFDNIALAEELIDQYVGFQQKFLRQEYHGEISALTNSNKTIADTNTQTQLWLNDGHYARTVLEMLSGNAIGLSEVIESSSRDSKSVTLKAAFSTTPAVGDVFRIYQLGKFPRRADAYTGYSGDHYYKTIPEPVRRATAAQVAFMIAQGADFFTGGASDMESESFLNYSYRRGTSGQSSLVKLISPQARTLLRGIVNRTGRLVAGGPNVSL